MKAHSIATAIALSIGMQASVFAADVAQQGPDLSGRWNRDLTVGIGSPARWGERVEISQSGVSLTVQPGSGKPERYLLNGKESAEVISVEERCKAKSRVTKAESAPGRVTITTWIVNKVGCAHREDEDDPLIGHLGAIPVEKVMGRRALESITVVHRDGNVMTVETTTAGDGGSGSTTTSAYRK